MVIYKFAELSALTLNSRSNDQQSREEKSLNAIEYIIAYLITLEFHELKGTDYANTDIKSFFTEKHRGTNHRKGFESFKHG